MICNLCPELKRMKERGDEDSWFICKLTGKQLYNRDRFQESPNNCPKKKTIK